jgi:toxin-antitoxin system PIN domain toxin
VINSPAAYAYSELVLSGFLRVVTHPKVFETPSTLSSALLFADQIRGGGHAICVAPGIAHWEIFTHCLNQLDAKGNDIPDAYQAALAMEWNCQWVTTDKGFKRFKGLRVYNPLKSKNSNA